MTLNHDILRPTTKLRRRQAAEALATSGFPCTESGLATLATRGGGPPFQRFGRIPLYEWGALLDWAQKRLTKPVTSTSELETLGAGRTKGAGGGAEAGTPR